MSSPAGYTVTQTDQSPYTASRGAKQKVVGEQTRVKHEEYTEAKARIKAQ